MAITQRDGVFCKSDECRSGRENERSYHGEKHLGEHSTEVQTPPEKDKHRAQS